MMEWKYQLAEVHVKLIKCLSSLNFTELTKIFILFNLFFLSATYSADINPAEVKKLPQPPKISNAKIFIANSIIPTILSNNFDTAVKWKNSDKNDLKTMIPAKKTELTQQSELFKANKEKIISKITEKIEKDLNDTFSEAELKYLVDQSKSPFFLKLFNFLLSNQLKRHLSEPFLEVNKLLSDSSTKK